MMTKQDYSKYKSETVSLEGCGVQIEYGAIDDATFIGLTQTHSIAYDDFYWEFSDRAEMMTGGCIEHGCYVKFGNKELKIDHPPKPDYIRKLTAPPGKNMLVKVEGLRGSYFSFTSDGEKLGVDDFEVSVEEVRIGNNPKFTFTVAVMWAKDEDKVEEDGSESSSGRWVEWYAIDEDGDVFDVVFSEDAEEQGS
jgi:hypothetical protein